MIGPQCTVRGMIRARVSDRFRVLIGDMLLIGKGSGIVVTCDRQSATTCGQANVYITYQPGYYTHLPRSRKKTIPSYPS